MQRLSSKLRSSFSDGANGVSDNDLPDPPKKKKGRPKKAVDPNAPVKPKAKAGRKGRPKKTATDPKTTITMKGKERPMKKSTLRKDSAKLDVVDDIGSTINDPTPSDSLSEFDLSKIADLKGVEDELSSLLPNLDQDLANLEANLGGLNFDEFDFDLGGNNTGDVDALLNEDGIDFDEALRSIESGDFDMTDFLSPEDAASLSVDDFSDRQSSSSDESSNDSSSDNNGNIKANKESKSDGTEIDSKLKKAMVDVEEAIEENSAEDEELKDDEDDGLGRDIVIEDDEDLGLDVALDADDEDDDEYDDEDIKLPSSRKASKSSGTITASSSSTDSDDKISSETPKEDVDVAVDMNDAATANDAATTDDGDTSVTIDKDAPLVIDGVEIETLGVETPPLEEFKRLMESLGSESMFEDDEMFEGEEDETQPAPHDIHVAEETNEDKVKDKVKKT